MAAEFAKMFQSEEFGTIVVMLMDEDADCLVYFFRIPGLEETGVIEAEDRYDEGIDVSKEFKALELKLVQAKVKYFIAEAFKDCEDLQ